jgi:hypothetical protein
MAKLPPPPCDLVGPGQCHLLCLPHDRRDSPRRANHRSGSVSAVTTTDRPSARTTRNSRMLSQAMPSLDDRHPKPPPRARLLEKTGQQTATTGQLPARSDDNAPGDTRVVVRTADDGEAVLDGRLVNVAPLGTAANDGRRRVWVNLDRLEGAAFKGIATDISDLSQPDQRLRRQRTARGRRRGRHRSSLPRRQSDRHP